MSQDDDENKAVHELFWAAWHMPYVEGESEEEKASKMNAVQELLAANLAQRMIATNSIDMNLKVIGGPNGEAPHYEFMARACITNPTVVVSEDVKFFNRIHDYADHYTFQDQDEKDLFYEVLDKMRPEAITMN